jgi:hypothetical protein
MMTCGLFAVLAVLDSMIPILISHETGIPGVSGSVPTAVMEIMMAM